MASWSARTSVAGPDSAKALDRPEDVFVYDPADTNVVTMWQQVDAAIGRRNVGVKLFNVASMLSNLLESPDGKGAILQLVNYSGFPVENVTVHLLGKYKSAQLLAPGAAPKKLEVYENEEGTGVDIESVGVAATLVLE